ncbi:MAG: HlyC/CorC family transporter [Bacteroidetes bacterium]|nr:HlyC/CorC family transporter [Bacteroidota bacterium]
MNEWLLILGTLILSGFFSGSEIAFVTANKLKLEVASRRTNMVAKAIEFFKNRPESFLTTTLVGNNIVNVVYATLMAIFLANPIQEVYLQYMGEVPSDLMVLSLQTVLASVLIMVFGEIVPKVIFRAQADTLVRFIALPLRVLHIALRPLIVIADSASKQLIRLISSETEDPSSIYRRQDVERIVQELRDSGGNGDLDQEDSEILHNVLELSNKRVKESMVPRIDIEAVEKGTSIEEISQLFISSGHSKLPVYKDSIDDVIGVVYAYDLFNRPKTVQEILRPIKLVPYTKKSKDLLAEFRQENLSVAIVLDEYGGTAGMVTIEDVLEELVGDIQDEHDVEDEIMKRISEHSYVVSGNVEIEELNQAFEELNLPEQPTEYDTIAGFIINHLGRIPRVNEECVIEGYRFIISKATQSRIETVKLVVLDA